MGRDQVDNAARVAHHGAGIRITSKASVARIREALTTLLSDPLYRANAERIGRAIRAELSEDRAVAELEMLAARNTAAQTAATPLRRAQSA